MVLVKVDICMLKNVIRSIFITLYETQVQVDKKNLNIKQDTLNSLECTGTGDNFSNRTSIAQTPKITN